MKTTCIITEAGIGLSPQDVAYHLKERPYLCFLDSSLCPDKYSRFSYIGWDPSLVIKSSGLENEFINNARGIRNLSYRDSLGFFRQYVNDFVQYGTKDIRILKDEGEGIREISIGEKYADPGTPDLMGGFMGYFSYDLKDYLEKLPHTTEDDLDVPLIYYGFYTRLLAYGHKKGKWYFIRSYIDIEDGGRLSEILGKEDLIQPGDDDSRIRERAVLELEHIAGSLPEKPPDIMNGIIDKYLKEPISRVELNPNIKKRQYLARVRKTRKYIHDGDIYQVNFSQRFKSRVPVDPMDLYYILRKKNAAPFSAYLKFPGFSIGSSSPERFLYLKDDLIETRPIKGTRPRGKDEAEDEKNARELRESIKDRAELNMIVDLERNDLGKFCYYGTVKVSGHAVIEKYARVFHSVSTVRGEVKEGADIADIIKASFPGGSITGAPKIRAMEIIDELETVSRGIYTGSIGYISMDAVMDLNIVIRTFIIKEGCFYYNVGGGIVADSDPHMEYQETLDKGIALEDTLNFFKRDNLARISRKDTQARFPG
jgi:para-aminobenzoate synthetase component I